jgi:hypothetical protein
VVTVRYAAPIIEETLKILLVWRVLHQRQIGFAVDAAQVGFAVGTGFALIENMVYLFSIASHDITVWIVRGVGTAMLHGGTTSIAAMVAKTVVDRSPDRLFRAIAAGWVPALIIHSAYNHLLFPPVASMLFLLIGLTLLVSVVFEHSETATREWVGAGLDLDLELLQVISSQDFHATRYGTYLQELRERFAGAVVVDMFCMLRLELELSVQVKALLLAREAGLKLRPHPDVAAGMRELELLRGSIGRTGLLALAPLHISSYRDQWYRYFARK